MRKSNKTFLPDTGNIGGRTQIYQIMGRHIESLKKVKAVLHISPPHPHINNGRPQKSFIKGKLYILFKV